MFMCHHITARVPGLLQGQREGSRHCQLQASNINQSLFAFQLTAVRSHTIPFCCGGGTAPGAPGLAAAGAAPKVLQQRTPHSYERKPLSWALF